MEELNDDGNKNLSTAELEAYLGDGSIDKAFKSQDVLNAIRMIILQDKEIMENSMRYNLPNRRWCIAAASYVRKCVEHGYNKGIDQVMMQLGFMTSIGGERIKQLVTAVIGEQKWQQGKGNGMIDKIKKLYGEQQ